MEDLERHILRFNTLTLDPITNKHVKSASGVDLANDKVCYWKTKVIEGKDYTKVYMESGYTFIAAMNERKWVKMYSDKMIDIDKEDIKSIISPPGAN